LRSKEAIAPFLGKIPFLKTSTLYKIFSSAYLSNIVFLGPSLKLLLTRQWLMNPFFSPIN